MTVQRNRQRLGFLTLIMLTASLSVLALCLWIFYQQGVTQQQQQLEQLIDSQKMLFSSTANPSKQETLEETTARIRSQFSHLFPFSDGKQWLLITLDTQPATVWTLDKSSLSSERELMQVKQTKQLSVWAEKLEKFAKNSNHSAKPKGFSQDYAHEKLLSAVRNIAPNSFLAITMKHSDAIAPFIATLIPILVLTLLITAIAVVSFWRLGNPILHSLSEKVSRLHAIVDTAVDGIITIDKQGIIDTFSRNAERLFGYKKEQVIGKNVKILMPAKRASEHDGYLHKYLNTGNKKIIGIGREVVAQRKDGSQFPVDLSISEFFADGQICFTGIIRDLTQQKHAEAELHKAEKEAQLHRERLAHVDRLSTMGEMAAGIAHEINQPLTAISSYIQASLRMLKENRMSQEELEKVLTKVVNQAHRAGEVIRHLRAFVKKQDSERITIDCNQLVDEIIDLIEPQSKQQDITIELKLSSQSLEVNVDAIQIQQVILNLLRNSMEAVQEAASPVRTVTIETDQQEDKQIIIRVLDQGRGMDMEIASQVFDPFYTTKKTGMGMGLSISRSIIQAHGGSLNYSANDPKGSIFTIALPTTYQATHQKEVL